MPREIDARRPRVADAFDRLDATGAATAECWSDYRRKVERWEAAPDRRAAFARDWPIHRRAIEALVLDPRSIVEGLRTAGAPTRFSELEPAVPADVARWAVASCHLMRDRFTLADLVDLTGAAGHGWDGAFADELLVEAASLGAGL
jgi:glycerol-1-phosphate dehydrogenase [NAD(P)+]